MHNKNKMSTTFTMLHSSGCRLGTLRTMFATYSVIPADAIISRKVANKFENMAGNFNRIKSCEFSSIVNVKEFREKIVGVIECDDIQRERTVLDKEKVALEMGISEETVEELDEVCRLVEMRLKNTIQKLFLLTAASFCTYLKI